MAGKENPWKGTAMRDHMIRLDRSCRAPVATLWATLLAPQDWWGKEVLLEPHAGGSFHEPWRDADGLHHTKGQVLDLEAPTRLRLSWQDEDWDFTTEVTFTLSAEDGGSRLELCHDGWHAAASDAQDRLVAAHQRGWAFHLGNLVACAESATRNPGRGEL